MRLPAWFNGNRRKPGPVSDQEWMRRAESDEPVGDGEFEEAYMWFMRNPSTISAPCGDPKPHGDHLWRHVFTPGGPPVDESMKKCPGYSQAPS